MEDPGHYLAVYLHLARASGQRRRPHVRDRLLVLASVIAQQMKLTAIARYCRQEVLRHNAQHLIRRWETVDEAMATEDFVCFLQQLRRRYPPERVEQMLATLEIDLAGERESYYSDYEYAAALLGTTPAALDRLYGP